MSHQISSEQSPTTSLILIHSHSHRFSITIKVETTPIDKGTNHPKRTHVRSTPIPYPLGYPTALDCSPTHQHTPTIPTPNTRSPNKPRQCHRLPTIFYWLLGVAGCLLWLALVNSHRLFRLLHLQLSFLGFMGQLGYVPWHPPLYICIIQELRFHSFAPVCRV
jgi:hypothetical protein